MNLRQTKDYKMLAENLGNVEERLDDKGLLLREHLLCGLRSESVGGALMHFV